MTHSSARTSNAKSILNYFILFYYYLFSRNGNSFLWVLSIFLVYKNINYLSIIIDSINY